MQDARPSRTAMRVAMRRAAHQIFDDPPRILEDPLAISIIGTEAAAQLKAAPRAQRGRAARSLRAFMAVRSRFAEDELARAVARGVTQYVVLGAGLDTYAYRHQHPPSRLRVFEVDHPATQEWKRRKLAAAAITIPSSVTFAPVDFEQQTLADGLERAGFNRQTPAFFGWLGVIMYLTEDAIDSTLTYIASMPAESGVAFDYTVPRSSLGFLGRLAFDAIAGRVARAGEPFRTFFEPPVLRERLTRMGFTAIEDLGSREINDRYFKNRTDGLRISGDLARLVSARV